MGLFDFLKKDKTTVEETAQEKYWSLTTDEGEVTGPDWNQVTEAIDKATSDESVFVSLAHMHAGHEIEIVQAGSLDGGKTYNVEALPPAASYDYGQIFVNHDVPKESAVSIFEEYFNRQVVVGFRSWKTEKI